ncbi:MAG: hypothetical protein LBP95_08260 [Deltaproteobacteria bacterium]|jgi:hypothetical protein|nr:hypothetical protein [Deltaproteobacteria bacterium]
MIIRCEKNRKLELVKAWFPDVLEAFEKIKVQEVLVRAGDPGEHLSSVGLVEYLGPVVLRVTGVPRSH